VSGLYDVDARAAKLVSLFYACPKYEHVARMRRCLAEAYIAGILDVALHPQTAPIDVAPFLERFATKTPSTGSKP
jgi:hypothetical protein